MSNPEKRPHNCVSEDNSLENNHLNCSDSLSTHCDRSKAVCIENGLAFPEDIVQESIKTISDTTSCPKSTAVFMSTVLQEMLSNIFSSVVVEDSQSPFDSDKRLKQSEIVKAIESVKVIKDDVYRKLSQKLLCFDSLEHGRVTSLTQRIRLLCSELVPIEIINEGIPVSLKPLCSMYPVYRALTHSLCIPEFLRRHAEYCITTNSCVCTTFSSWSHFSQFISLFGNTYPQEYTYLRDYHLNEFNSMCGQIEIFLDSGVNQDNYLAYNYSRGIKNTSIVTPTKLSQTALSRIHMERELCLQVMRFAHIGVPYIVIPRGWMIEPLHLCMLIDLKSQLFTHDHLGEDDMYCHKVQWKPTSLDDLTSHFHHENRIVLCSAEDITEQWMKVQEYSYEDHFLEEQDVSLNHEKTVVLIQVMLWKGGPMEIVPLLFHYLYMPSYFIIFFGLTDTSLHPSLKMLLDILG